jgi:hypothetical protein
VRGRFTRLDDGRDACCELSSLGEPAIVAIRASLDAPFVLVVGNTGSGKSSLTAALATEDLGRQTFDEVPESTDLPAPVAGLGRGRVIAICHVAEPGDVRSMLAWMGVNSDVLAGRNPYIFNVWRNYAGGRTHRHLVAMGHWSSTSGN